MRFLFPSALSLSSHASPHCPSCRRQLSNATPLTCLAHCGHVHCSACVHSLRAGGNTNSAAVGSSGDVECVECGEVSAEQDQVKLIAGTGFASSAGGVSVAQMTPAFVC